MLEKWGNSVEKMWKKSTLWVVYIVFFLRSIIQQCVLSK